jgi:hypothetical protein
LNVKENNRGNLRVVHTWRQAGAVGGSVVVGNRGGGCGVSVEAVMKTCGDCIWWSHVMFDAGRCQYKPLPIWAEGRFGIKRRDRESSAETCECFEAKEGDNENL